MTTVGLVTPTPRQYALDEAASLPGAKLFFYQAGSDTLATTYSNAALTSANTNPVVASASGLFGPIYLDYGVVYDVELQTSLGLTVWTQPNVGVSGVSATPYGQTFNVVTYGAVGNGIADDATAIQAAITAASTSGGTVYFPAGTYRCVAALSCTANNVQFRGENRATAILQWTDAATTGLTIDTATNAAASSSLTVNGAIGDYAVTVADGSVFTAGRNAYLETADTTLGSFMTTIASIAANVVTLTEALPCVLPTASTAVLKSYTTALRTGISITDLTFSCVGGAGTANKLTLLLLSRIQDVLVERCAFDGSVGPLLTTGHLKDGVIRACTFMHAQTIAGSAIEAQTSTGLTIEACQARAVQFGFVTSRSPRTRIVGCGASTLVDGTNIGRSVKIANGSNFSTVIGSPASDANLTALRIESASHCTVTGNTFLAYSAGENGAAAISLAGTASKCLHNTASGNTIVGGGANAAGIACVYEAGGTATYNTIVGNNISGCKRYGIYCGSNKNTIQGNQIGSSDTGALLYVPALCGSNTITGNVFTNEGASTAASIHTVDGTGGNYIGPNILGSATSPLNLAATDVNWAPQLTQPILLTPASPVETGANTTETDLFRTTIPAGLFTSANTQGFDLHAHLKFPNGNGKTLIVYVGNANQSTGSFTDNNCEADLFVRGYNKSSANKGFVFSVDLVIGIASGPVAGLIRLARWTSSTNDPATAFDIAITGTNGSASAGDIQLDFAALTFMGSPVAAYR